MCVKFVCIEYVWLYMPDFCYCSALCSAAAAVAVIVFLVIRFVHDIVLRKGIPNIVHENGCLLMWL